MKSRKKYKKPKKRDLQLESLLEHANRNPQVRKCNIQRPTSHGRYWLTSWTDDHLLPPWRYQQWDILKRPKKAVGFVYEIAFVDGSKYIGRRLFDGYNDWLHYVGSGSVILKAIKQTSKASIVAARVIRSFHYTDRELADAEVRLQAKLNVVENSGYLNRQLGSPMQELQL